MNGIQLKHILEGALLAAGRPLAIDDLLALFPEDEQPERDQLQAALEELRDDYAERGFHLKEVASGFRLQVNPQLAPWVSKLWMERPSRYSRALLETLALIAYRQPITRGEIEDIRGVSVSTTIMKTLQDREWIRVVGHRDVPGRPAMYATTRQFLDYFNLKGLDELPTLAELRDIESINAELEFELSGTAAPRVEGPNADADADEEEAADIVEDALTGQGDEGEAVPLDALVEAEAAAEDGDPELEHEAPGTSGEQDAVDETEAEDRDPARSTDAG